mmetsp:Transcript_42108/g.82712  ORF Transcript_42108/g.82712 Transcript_42108/m.82712 type:complete len:690 (-) Transcript_42108:60-2129(-)
MSKRNDLMYSALNINIDNDGDIPGGKILKKNVSVSLLVSEKITLVLHWLQTVGVLWVISKGWPWPRDFLNGMVFTLVLNFDASTFLQHFFLPNDNFYLHMVGGGALPVIWFVIFLLTRKFNSVTFSNEISKSCVSKLTRSKICIMVGQLLYLPCCLYLFRVLACNLDGVVPYMNSGTAQLQCWSIGHITAIGVVGALSGSFVLVFPFYLWKIAKGAVTFHKAPMHERFLQTRETEYLMGVNSLYEQNMYFVIASYRRPFAFYPVFQLVEKLCFAAVSVFLAPAIRYSGTLQSVALTTRREEQVGAFFSLLTVAHFAKLFWTMYRLHSTNMQRAVLDWGLWLAALIGILSAGGVETSFLVASTLYKILYLLLGLAMFAAVCIGVFFKQSRRERWPTVPVDVEHLAIRYPECVSAINESKQLIHWSASTAHEFYPRYHLVELIQTIRALMKRHCNSDNSANWQLDCMAAKKYAKQSADEKKQRKVGGVTRSLSSLSADNTQSLLDRIYLIEWTLQDLSEDLASLHHHLKTEAGAQQSGPARTARLERLRGKIEGMRESMVEKKHQFILVRPEARLLVQKLLVLRGLLGQDISAGTRAPWDPNTAASEHVLEAGQRMRQDADVRRKGRKMLQAAAQLGDASDLEEEEEDEHNDVAPLHARRRRSSSTSAGHIKLDVKKAQDSDQEAEDDEDY